MLVGVLAAVAFATGDRWGLVLGAVLLQAAFTLDCVDGQLARYTRTFTPLGAWLDSIFDRGKEYVVYAGLAIGAGDDVWLLAAAALALQTVRHAGDFAFNARARRGDQGAARGAAVEAREGRPAAGAVRVRRAEAVGAQGVRAADRRALRADLAHRRVLRRPRDVRRARSPGADSALAWTDVRPALALARQPRARRRSRQPSTAPPDRCRPIATTAPSRALLGRIAGPARRIPPVALLLAGGLPLLAAGGDRARGRLLVADRRMRGLGRALRRALERPPAARSAALGGAAAPARDRAAARSSGSPPRRATTPTRPRSRCSPRSPSATTTSPTASPSAARRRRARLGLLLGGWDGRLLPPRRSAPAGAAAAGFYLLARRSASLAVGEAVAFWLRGDQTVARLRRRRRLGVTPATGGRRTSRRAKSSTGDTAEDVGQHVRLPPPGHVRGSPRR